MYLFILTKYSIYVIHTTFILSVLVLLLILTYYTVSNIVVIGANVIDVI